MVKNTKARHRATISRDPNALVPHATVLALEPEVLHTQAEGAHSLRSGFVTESGRQNVPMKEAMAMTGHRSVQTFLRYFQPGSVQVSRAAKLLGDAPSPEGCGSPDCAEEYRV